MDDKDAAYVGGVFALAQLSSQLPVCERRQRFGKLTKAILPKQWGFLSDSVPNVKSGPIAQLGQLCNKVPVCH